MLKEGSCRVQVYEHHCIEQLPGPTRRLRDGALYMANNIEAVQWALELYGFKDVCIKVIPGHPVDCQKALLCMPTSQVTI